MQINLSKSLWLALVIMIATVLRFYGIWDQEFSYDELSAIFRAENAKNWHEHIHDGVIPDGHPAGLQTFIWLYIKFFGISMIWLKSIMAICGIGSVYFIYKAGKNIANPQAALFASLLMAALQLPVFWSLQLRPYAPGMLAVSGFLWTLTELVFNGSQKRKIYWLSIVFLTCSFYLHYFAGLTAIIIFTCGFFRCHKNQKLSYILSGLTAGILFLPHISITLIQFSNKGLGWLSAPTISFFSEHLHHIFSLSWLLFILIIIFTITGAILAIRNHLITPETRKRFIFLAFVFITPLLVGFFYSKLRSPGLQHSVLLFSMPAFFLFISMLVGLIPEKIFRISFFITAFCSIFVLTAERKFYGLANRNAYRSELECANYYAWSLGKNNVAIWLDGENDILEYHVQKNAENGNSYNRLNNYDTETFIHLLDRWKSNFTDNRNRYLAIGLQSGVNPMLKAELEERYGRPQKFHYFNGGEFLLFQLNKKTHLEYTRILTKKSEKMTDNSFQITLKDSAITHQDFIVVKLQSIASTGKIQTIIQCSGNQIDWRETLIKPYNFMPNDYTYSTTLHVIKLADIPAWNKECNTIVKLILERNNSDLSNSEIHNLSYRIMKGNPYLYGIN